MGELPDVVIQGFVSMLLVPVRNDDRYHIDVRCGYSGNDDCGDSNLCFFSLSLSVTQLLCDTSNPYSLFSINDKCYQVS